MFLLCPIVPLINPDYASAASTQMVQHRLGDFEAHAEALQPCRKRPAQVVQPPAGNTGCGVERRLRFRPAAKGRSALAGEDASFRKLVRALGEGIRTLDPDLGKVVRAQIISDEPAM